VVTSDGAGFVFVGFVRFYPATNANHLPEGAITCGMKIKLESGTAKRNARIC
jgi:hypothetical protein